MSYSQIYSTRIVLEKAISEALAKFQERIGFSLEDAAEHLIISSHPSVTLIQDTKVSTESGDLTTIKMETSIEDNRYIFDIKITEPDYIDFNITESAHLEFEIYDNAVVDYVIDNVIRKYTAYLKSRVKGEKAKPLNVAWQVRAVGKPLESDPVIHGGIKLNSNIYYLDEDVNFTKDSTYAKQFTSEEEALESAKNANRNTLPQENEKFLIVAVLVQIYEYRPRKFGKSLRVRK